MKSHDATEVSILLFKVLAIINASCFSSSSGHHWVKIDVSYREHSEMTMISKEQVKILKGENVFMSMQIAEV